MLCTAHTHTHCSRLRMFGLWMLPSMEPIYVYCIFYRISSPICVYTFFLLCVRKTDWQSKVINKVNEIPLEMNGARRKTHELYVGQKDELFIHKLHSHQRQQWRIKSKRNERDWDTIGNMLTIYVNGVCCWGGEV